jgi:hypothetical protein
MTARMKATAAAAQGEDGKINDAGMALRKAEEAGEYPSHPSAPSVKGIDGHVC